MASDLKLINEKVSSMSLASTVDLSQSNRSNSGNGILSSQDSSPLGTAMILKEESKVDYTKIMLERWNKSNSFPNFLWSLFFASSNNNKYSSNSF